MRTETYRSSGVDFIDRLVHACLVLVVLGGASPFLGCSDKEPGDGESVSDPATATPGRPRPPAIVPTGTDLGTVPGSLSVGPSGAASYLVPLWTPQGRNGLTPSLALSYSSAGGDGPVGLGWGLSSGESMIHRCPTNSQRVARPKSVTFERTDRLCLDGRSLVLVGGTHPEAGAEYRTEPETFTKIVVEGSNAEGPTGFTVFTRDGLIHTYGMGPTAVDSGLVVAGAAERWSADPVGREDQAVRKTSVGARYGWLRGSTRDRFNNRIHFRYIHPVGRDLPGGRQEPLLDKIEYVDVGGFQTRSIQLTYVDRPPVAQRFGSIVGLAFSSTKLLTSIDMRVARPGTRTLVSARFYELTQAPSPSTGRPLLRALRECDGNPATVTGRAVACKRPSTFTYQEASDTFQEVDTGIKDVRNPVDGDFWGLQVADLNNDGRDDIVYRARPAGAGPEIAPHWFARLSTAAGLTDTIDLKLQENLHTGDAIIADFAGGDGRPDIAVPAGPESFAFYRNDGITETEALFAFIGSESTQRSKGMHVGDFGGKGRPSILRPNATGNRWVYRFARNTEDGPTLTGTSEGLEAGWQPNFADVGWNSYVTDEDGDGALDFLALPAGDASADRLSLFLQRRAPRDDVAPSAADWTGPSPITLLTSKAGDLTKHYFFDHNGDGLRDAIRLRQGRDVPDLIVNSGSGFAQPLPLTSLSGTAGNIRLGTGASTRDIADPGIRFLDYDQDGRDDILLVDDGVARDSSAPGPATRSNLTLLLSRADGFEIRPLPIPLGLPASGPTRADSPGVKNYKQSQVIDLDGDGLSDITLVTPAGLKFWIRRSKLPDVLIGVKDGMGKRSSITYLPMIDPEVYTPGTTCQHPQECDKGGQWLVASYRQDNGIENQQNEVRCRYVDRRTDVEGAGVLGFREWMVTNVAAKTTVTQVYDLTSKAKVRALDDEGQPTMVDVYSKIGLPVGVVREVASASFNRFVTSTTDYEFVATNGGASYNTRPTETRSAEVEIRGGQTEQVSREVRVFTYDPGFNDFGVGPDVRTTTTTALGVQIDEIKVTFDNHPERWLLGLETGRTMFSKAFSGEEETRTTASQPDPLTGAVLNTTVEPGDTTGDTFLHTQLVRNDFGQVRLIQQTDRVAHARSDTLDYDSDSVHVVSHTNALNHVTRLSPDPALGVVQSMTDPNNVTTTFDYDAFGRVRAVNEPGGGMVSITYARDIEAGSLPQDERFVAKVTTTRNGGGEQRTVTNRLGREIRREGKNLDGSFSFTNQTYDPLGQPHTSTRPARAGQPPGPATIRAFDELGRLTARTRPEDGMDPAGTVASTVTTSVDHAGLVATTTDDFGRISRHTRDAFGRTHRTENRNDLGQFVPAEYTYGPFDVLRSVTRKNGTGNSHQTTVLDYDVLGRRTRLSDPDTGLRTVRYNAFGEVRAEVDAAGALTTYGDRDRLGRVTEKTDKDGTTKFVWDTAANGRGKIAETTSPSGVRRQFLYDVIGRMHREVWTVAGSTFQVDYSFDSFGRPHKVSYPAVNGFSRLVVRNVYDADSGELAKVQNDSSGHTYWELKATTVDGQIGRETFGNRIVTDYEYSDQTGRVGAIESALPGAPVPARSWAYGYWRDGNLARRSDVRVGQHERFEYDEFERIKRWLAGDSSGREAAGGWSVNYTIDDFGNLTRRNLIAGTATGGASQDLSFVSEPGKNRVVSSTFGAFDYDANGNQIGRPGVETVTYTAFDLPKQITGPRSVAFLYDAFGIRAKKRKSDTEYTIYVADLYEKRVKGSAADHVFYITAAGRPVAQVIRKQGGGISPRTEIETANTPTTPNEVVLYLHADRLGSVDTVTNSSGAVVERTSRDPFGNEVKNFNEPALPGVISTSSRNVRLGFTGHEQDDELGLVNMRGRLYDGRVGKFLTPDPFVTEPLFGQSYNRYSYAFGNPLKYIDPSGFENQGPGGDRTVAPEENNGNGCAPGMWRLAGGGCYTIEDLYAYARSMGLALTCNSSTCTTRPYTFTDDPPGGFTPGSIQSTPQPGAGAPSTPSTAATGDAMGQATPPPPKKPDTKKAACCGCACGGSSNPNGPTTPVLGYLRSGARGPQVSVGARVGASARAIGQGAALMSVAAVAFAAEVVGDMVDYFKNDPGYRTFYHGTDVDSALAMVATHTILPVSENTAPYPPGSFFTFEASSPNAQVAASHFAINRAAMRGKAPAVIAIDVPNRTLAALAAAGWIEQSFLRGPFSGFPMQTVFLPPALPVLSATCNIRQVEVTP
jgi:RHS repeat-associated protein